MSSWTKGHKGEEMTPRRHIGSYAQAFLAKRKQTHFTKNATMCAWDPYLLHKFGRRGPCRTPSPVPSSTSMWASAICLAATLPLWLRRLAVYQCRCPENKLPTKKLRFQLVKSITCKSNFKTSNSNFQIFYSKCSQLFTWKSTSISRGVRADNGRVVAGTGA